MPKEWLLFFVVIVGCTDVRAAGANCPDAPDQFARNVIEDAKVKVGKLGPISAGEVGSRTEVVVNDLLGKVPNLDKYLYCKAVQSIACQWFSTIKDPDERLDKWEKMNAKCYEMLGIKTQPPPAPPVIARGGKKKLVTTTEKKSKEQTIQFSVATFSLENPTIVTGGSCTGKCVSGTLRLVAHGLVISGDNKKLEYVDRIRGEAKIKRFTCAPRKEWRDPNSTNESYREFFIAPDEADAKEMNVFCEVEWGGYFIDSDRGRILFHVPYATATTSVAMDFRQIGKEFPEMWAAMGSSLRGCFLKRNALGVATCVTSDEPTPKKFADGQLVILNKRDEVPSVFRLPSGRSHATVDRWPSCPSSQFRRN